MDAGTAGLTAAWIVFCLPIVGRIRTLVRFIGRKLGIWQEPNRELLPKLRHRRLARRSVIGLVVYVPAFLHAQYLPIWGVMLALHLLAVTTLVWSYAKLRGLPEDMPEETYVRRRREAFGLADAEWRELTGEEREAEERSDRRQRRVVRIVFPVFWIATWQPLWGALFR